MKFTVCTFCLYTPTFKYKNTLVMDKQGLALQRAEGRGAFGSPWKSRMWLHTSPCCCLHRAGLSPVTKPSEFGTPRGTRTMSRDEKNVLSLHCWMQGCSRKTQTRQCLLCHGQAEILLQLLSWLCCPAPFLPPPPPHLQFPPQGRHLLPGSGPAVPLDNKIKLFQVPKASNTFQCGGCLSPQRCLQSPSVDLSLRELLLDGLFAGFAVREVEAEVGPVVGRAAVGDGDGVAHAEMHGLHHPLPLQLA